jgi:hypothetical protein
MEEQLVCLRQSFQSLLCCSCCCALQLLVNSCGKALALPVVMCGEDERGLDVRGAADCLEDGYRLSKWQTLVRLAASRERNLALRKGA